LDRRALLASLAVAAIPRSVLAAAAASDYPALRAFLEGYVMSGRLPGGVIAIKRADEPVRYISAGTLAFDTKAAAGPDSLWRIYSMTKPITGMAAMKLIEDGKLRLDQPLAEILPEFKDMQVIADPQTMATRPAARPILIRNLLTHTAGFSYHIFTGPLAKLYMKNGIRPGDRAKVAGPGELPPPKDLEEFAARLSKLPLESDPGTRWSYSVALDLTGLVIQRVSGKPFYDYLRTSFFEPLKMRDTDFMVPKSKLERFATTVLIDKGRPLPAPADDRKSSPFARDRDLPSGGGGLVSSAHDYARFVSMMLNEGTLDGVRVVKPETVRLARSNLLPPGVLLGKNGYGAAMQVILPGGERPGQEPPGSYSWFGIAGSQMWIDPSNRLGVMLMVNFLPNGSYPVQAEVKTAAYKDLAALKA
jgi:CubicO group peptidase (beta-lactamase class C family)